MSDALNLIKKNMSIEIICSGEETAVILLLSYCQTIFKYFHFYHYTNYTYRFGVAITLSQLMFCLQWLMVATQT